MKQNISISILDVEDVNEYIKKVKNIHEKITNIDSNCFDLLVHFDIMDNKFVNNSGTKLEYIKIANELGIYSDVHLMVEKPIEDGYIDNAIKYGANRISIHYEIENFEQVIKYLNSFNIDVGVVVKPNTDIEELKKYKNMFSALLVMTVEPGYGGQKYITQMNEKIKYAKSIFSDKCIQIDGGVNLDTIQIPLQLGVDSFVVGSYLAKAKNTEKEYKNLNIIKDILLEERTENIDFSKRILQIVDNGYGKDDILLGIRTPNMRRISRKWYRSIDLDLLEYFITSNIHEYRQFAIFLLTYMLNDSNSKYIFEFINDNIKYINNWDLTDIVGPNIIGKYLYKLNNKDSKKIIQSYMSNDNVWIKRIGIVCLLEYARKGNVDVVIDNIENVMYEEYHLHQKASGWVLREAYKKDKKIILEFLYRKNKEKKLPSILLSYSCEKMTIQEKEKIRGKK